VSLFFRYVLFFSKSVIFFKFPNFLLVHHFFKFSQIFSNFFKFVDLFSNCSLFVQFFTFFFENLSFFPNSLNFFKFVILFQFLSNSYFFWEIIEESALELAIGECIGTK